MSVAMPPAGPDAEAGRIGAELRAARARHGWSVAEAAAALRIREDYLRAIEAGRTAALPGPAYAIGFVRNYAALLRLDADALVRRFRACLLDAPEPALFFPPPARTGLPGGAAIALGLLLACGAYFGCYRIATEDGARADRVEAVPERLAALTAPPGAVRAHDPSPPPVEAAEDLPDAAAGAPIAAVEEAAPIVPAAAAAAGAQIVIRAHADCWIQVRDGAAVLVARTLHAGESWSPEPGRSLAALLLTAGNAGGIDLLLDGRLAPPLGGPGMVRRDIPLDPDAIRSMAQTASIAASGVPGIASGASASTPPGGAR